METVIIVIHLMVIVALIAVVLMQRSEGGALGIGGGGNFLSTRGQTNVLTRTTAILAAAFFATSIALTVLSRFQENPAAILDNVQTTPAPISTDNAGGAPAADTSGTAGSAAAGGAGGAGTTNNGPGILDELQKITPVPTGQPDSTTGQPQSTDGAPATPQVPTSQ
jgi:preprotein translocase subunit SecG